MSQIPAWAEGLRGLDGWEIDRSSHYLLKSVKSIEFCIDGYDGLMLTDTDEDSINIQFPSLQAAIDAANALICALEGKPDPRLEAMQRVVDAARVVRSNYSRSECSISPGAMNGLVEALNETE